MISPKKAPDPALTQQTNRSSFRAEVPSAPTSPVVPASVSQPSIAVTPPIDSTDLRQSPKVPKELQLKYGYWERAQLIMHIGVLENKLERSDSAFEKTKDYLEQLLQRVMLESPELLRADQP